MYSVIRTCHWGQAALWTISAARRFKPGCRGCFGSWGTISWAFTRPSWAGAAVDYIVLPAARVAPIGDDP